MASSTKPSMYVLLASSKTLSRSSGDAINEFRLYDRLSEVFDVYYNNDIVEPHKEIIGRDDSLGPDRKYDFHYIRNNKDVFRSISGFKIALAYPFDKEVFEAADALFVYTESWKSHLRGECNHSAERLAGVYEGRVPSIDVPIVNVGQSMDINFLETEKNTREVFKFLKQSFGAHVFGYYGNLHRDLYPYEAFRALEAAYFKTGECSPVIGLAGRFRAASSVTYRNSAYFGQIPYAKMPFLLDGTTAILTNESALNHCLGSQKVVDAIARGVPVLCRPYDVFREQLGPDYPCYYETRRCAEDLAVELVTNPEFAKSVADRVCERRRFYTKNSVVEETRKQFEEYGLI